MGRDAQVQPESYNADANTIEIVWTTGAAVRRYDWWDGTEYDEVLSLDPGSVRLERLNLGAPFLDSHCSHGLDSVIGSVVPGSAKVENGRGLATIQLSKASGLADTVQKIAEGVIRNISVGYWLHKIVKTEGDDGQVARWDVTDWEPLEISAVPIPADPGSQIRSVATKTKDGPATRSCLLVTKTKTAAHGPNVAARQENTVALKDTTADEQKRRLAALRAMGDDDTASEDDKRDQEDSDGEMDAEEPENKDEDGDEGRDAADGDDEDHEDEDDKAEKKDDDKRAIDDAAKRAAAAAVKAERLRISEISDIAAQARLADLGKRHIAKGTSVRAFKDMVFKRMLERQNKRGDVSIAAAATTKDNGEASSATAGDAKTRAYEEAAATARKLLGKKVA